MTRMTAAILSALDLGAGLGAAVAVFASDDMQVIVTGDLVALMACLLAIPLLHYWIEGR